MDTQVLGQVGQQLGGTTDVYTSSTIEQQLQSDDIPTTRPSAPSDFFSRLPSSANKLFVDEQPHSTPGSGSDATNRQIDAQGRTLNPRSCVTCRKRKVKCDKVHPCSNCNRAHIECVYPSPGRAQRKIKKPGEGRDKELLERLRRLEGVVKGLGVEVSDKEIGEQVEHAGPRVSQHGTPGEIREETAGDEVDVRDGWAYQYLNTDHANRTRWVDERQKGQFENRFGRLVVNEGKSRYINNSFWANLSNEVEDLKGILNQPSDDEDAEDSPDSSANISGIQQGWVFGFSSLSVDLLSLHPLPGQIQAYWTIYKDRVDPLVKVLHIPTIEPTILSAASHLSNLSKGFEALLFAIYYGATTSLNAEDCRANFGEEKTVLLARYRFAIEQALSRANFLTTEETVVLQAFVIFLICLRRNNDARVIWTLTGLVVRIAQTLGVHRDGTHFGLSPFEIEMRRRLWWQVCVLDTRASEDHGCDPTIIEQSFDTKMPLNLNDVDITPDMKDFPPERTGCTDMSFCLIRFEVANTFRRINYVPPGPPRQCTDFYKNVTLQDKEKWITECHNRLEERYLKHCDMSVPLFWVTATVARLIMSKMWLMVYHPFQRQDGGVSLPDETKEKLFITSLENIEYSILLETEARTMKWGWLFKTYMQWHALAFILSELCQRTTGDLVDRAWKAVEKTRDGRWGVRLTDHLQANQLWRPLRKLYRKAKEERARGLQEETLKKPQLPPQRTYSPNANPMFGHPQRPWMTRAPLSQAQAQRFANGPTFGEMPVDKHELFRSPKLSETAGQVDVDPMEAMSLQSTNVPQPPGQNIFPNGHSIPLNAGYPMFDTLSATQTMQQPNPQYATNFYQNPNTTTTATNPVDFTTLPNNQYYSRDPTRMNSLDSNGELDMSIMDTSGAIDWQNWDQLVKQFGMDVDSVPGTGGGTDWAGGNWDVLANGTNSARGMGGGDWF